MNKNKLEDIIDLALPTILAVIFCIVGLAVVHSMNKTDKKFYKSLGFGAKGSDSGGRRNV